MSGDGTAAAPGTALPGGAAATSGSGVPISPDGLDHQVDDYVTLGTDPTGTDPTGDGPTGDGDDPGGPRLRWWREIVYIVLVYVAYSAVRNQFGSGAGDSVDPRPAFHHGEAIIQLQRNIGLYFEDRLQQWYLDLPLDDVDPFELYAGDDRSTAHGRPWVLANMIASLDGAAAGPDGRSGSINGPADLRAFTTLRAWADYSGERADHEDWILKLRSAERRVAAGLAHS